MMHRERVQKPADSITLGYGDYLRFSRLVHDRYGLNFPEKRRGDLERGIRQAFAASMCEDVEHYYHLLLDPDHGAVHLQRLVNILTIGESHFFRNAGQFDVLFQKVLPEIVAKRRAMHTLRIWSAGCAGGEEPYSIAMMLRELLPDVDQWAIVILGTDINTEALDRARRGLYGEWAFREERAKRLRDRYFQKADKYYQLAAEVRNMVTFQQLNLAEDCYPSFATNTTFMDLILCRNVTIYFTPSVTRDVVGRFYETLVDGGWLVIGHSEHSLSTYQRFQARSYPSAILYQRTGEPTILPEDWDWLTPTPAGDGVPSLRIPPDPKPPEIDTPSSASLFLNPHPATEAARPDAVVHQAQELLSYGRSEEARDVLKAFLDQQGEVPAACALLGKAYANLGHWEDAAYWCRRAITLDKVMSEPYYTLSLVLQHVGELDEAVQMMKKVVYLDHNSILGHYGLANLYCAQGQLPQALKSLNNARRLLEDRVENELIPNSDGITVGRLREAIVYQQQQLNAEAAGLS